MTRNGYFWISVALLAAIAAWSAFSHLSHEQQVRYESRLDQARSMFNDAVALESDGRVQAAYRRYSTICEGSFRISRDDVPAGACDGAVRLYASIRTAYEHTMAALERYREATGRYPDALSAIANDIPESSVAAFSGFEYVRRSDTDVAIVTGAYGSVAFDLSGR